ncbi:MAG: transporter substrate-binding domain-containing protein [Candidatus Binatia bacterium]
MRTRGGWRTWTRLSAVGLAALALSGCASWRGERDYTPTGPVLRVATSGDYAPFSIVNPEDELTGLDLALSGRLGQDLGRPVEIVRVAWPELAAATQAGTFDIAMSGITMRPERALVGCFTRPYAVVGAVALVRTTQLQRLPSAEALDRPGVRIAVNAGGHLERLARERFAQASIELVSDNQTVPQRLTDGAVDAAITDSAEVEGWLRPGLSVIGPFSIDYKAFLLPAAQTELAGQVDVWLAEREEDGWLERQRLQWMGPDAGMTPEVAARNAVVAFIRLRLQLAPAIAAAKRGSDQPIEDPGQEARVLERARAAARRDPQRAAAVYAQLIALSKAVQQSATPSDIDATLPALREALARIDAGLGRELDAPAAGTVDEWQRALRESIDLPGLEPAMLDELARLLAAPA